MPLADQQQALALASQAADTLLSFDEATTRRMLIDVLAESGWKVGKNGVSTEEVRQELPVEHQPTPSGKGAADYALFGEDDKPLAVIEAEKTATDPEAGRTQARCYAEGLERQYGGSSLHLLHQRLRSLVLERGRKRAAA